MACEPWARAAAGKGRKANRIQSSKNRRTQALGPGSHAPGSWESIGCGVSLHVQIRGCAALNQIRDPKKSDMETPGLPGVSIVREQPRQLTYLCFWREPLVLARPERARRAGVSLARCSTFVGSLCATA